MVSVLLLQLLHSTSFCTLKYFVLPKALKPYKNAKMPETTQNQKERKLFAARVQEKHQIEHVWVSFHMFWRPTFFMDENCKFTEPMHFWTWVLLRAFCTTFRRKRFIART